MKSIKKKGVLRNSGLACLDCRFASSKSKLAMDASYGVRRADAAGDDDGGGDSGSASKGRFLEK